MAQPTPGRPPTPPEHVAKADENKKFGLGMLRTHPTSACWALTALFYSALHYTEAYFLKISVHAEDHQQRIEAIKFDSKLRNIYPHYRYLYDYSYNARYTLIVHGKTDVDNAIPRLEIVEKHVKGLLGISPLVAPSKDPQQSSA